MPANTIQQSILRSWPQALVFAAGYVFVLYTKGWDWGVAGWTFAGSVLVLLAYRALETQELLRKTFAYAIFFVTPVLSLTGQISVLTGFGGSGASLPWVGISFVTASLALHIFAGKLDAYRLWSSVVQPLRMNSGPVALIERPMARLTRARFWYYAGWILLGGFFYGVLSAAIQPFLILKGSTDPLDSLVFATLFEFYVYFNFSGITFMVYGLLSLAGVRTVVNFNTPFAARDVVGYWQRWHVSLTTVLKEVFFRPLKGRIGIAAGVYVVFLSSAAWHGVSLNYFLWGLFHATGWIFAYTIWRSFPFRRIGFWINFLTFPFFVVIGRLIFSESNIDVLLDKLDQLLHFSVNADALVLNMVVDGQTSVMLAAGALCIGMEVILGVRFRRYRLLRKKWAMLALLALCVLFGSTGLGGVYGAR